jgi:class 3 adenylate cyclase
MSVTSTRSVLVTDLRASTDLRVRVGDAAFDAIRREHDQLLAGAAEAGGGEVVKGSGDGVIVLFDAAHEAISASVAMQQAVAARNRRAPEELALAIGISAGDVALEDGDCHGLPVVEAARLCSAAAGSEVLVADVVRVLAGTRSTHELESAGALDLKGLPAPLLAWLVTWSASGGTPLPMPDALAAAPFPYVGRERERERLREVWKEAVAGTAHLLFISGEPGIGKTRLVADLATELHADGEVVLFGRCDEDLAIPYQPFIEPFAALLDSSPALSAEHLAEHAGLLARLHPSLGARVGDAPPATADPESERQRTFDAAVDLLARAAAEHPVLLVLDDLHWATAPTLSLLRHVLRRATRSRLMIVGTYRDTDLDRAHPLAAVLADLRSEGIGERMALSGLDAADVEAFVTAAAGHALEADGRELAAALHAETEGNPLFVGEVLIDLAESGAIAQQDGRWSARGGVSTLRLPQGLREVIGRRLSRLSDTTNRVLAVASVAGATFDVVTVEHVHEPASEVLDALDAAVAAGIVAEDTARVGNYTFTHALVRQTLLSELSNTRRLRFHGAIGEAILAVHANDDERVVSDLALHFCEAAPLGQAARAVEYAQRASAQALTRFAPDEALEWLLRALEADDLDPSHDERRRLELLQRVSQLRFGRGERELTIAAALEGAELARALGDQDTFAEAVAFAVQSVAFGLMDPRIDPYIDEVLASAPQRSRTRGVVLIARALQAVFNADLDDPIALAEQGLIIARECGDEELGAFAFMVRAHARQADPDAGLHLDECRTSFQYPFVFGTEFPDGEQPTMQRFALGYALARVGALDELRTNRDELIDVATKRGSRVFAAAGAQWFVLESMLTGDLEAAEQQANAVLEFSGDEPMFLAGHAMQLLWLRLLQGRRDDALVIARLIDDALPEELSRFRVICRLAPAIEFRDPGAVRQALDALPGNPLDIVRPDWTRSAMLLSLAGAAWVTGDRVLGRSVYELLLPYDGQLLLFVCTHVPASAAYTLARAAIAVGEAERAVSHLEDAIAFEDGLGARVLATRSRVLLAELLASSDPERSRELARDALFAAQEIGLGGSAEKAATLAE